ncbi:MAG: hypothetical protein ACYTGQ_05765, partial [Planctomycetota bacterium]
MAAEQVGAFGDFRRLDIQGAHAAGAERVRDALRKEFHLQMASTPSAQLDHFIDVLKRKLLLGYQNNGFPDAKAVVQIDREVDRLRLEINEGLQWVQGDIIVRGEGGLEDAFVVGLTAKAEESRKVPKIEVGEDGAVSIKGWKHQEEEQDALWEKGKPHSFVKIYEDRLRRGIGKIMLIHGYLDIRFGMELVREQGQVDLVIHVVELGPKIQLGKIQVVGLKRHTREEVLGFLGLEEGQGFNRQRFIDIHQRLF